MDVLEFGKIQKRMCVSYYNCTQCPLNYGPCRIGNGTSEDDKKILEVVERWAKGHPVKTRQVEFLKLFPNAKRDDDGVIRICPMFPDENFECDNRDCDKCRKEYWLKEID